MKKFFALLLALLLALSAVAAWAAEYTDKDTVAKVQQALNDAGYDCGTPDGIAGRKTAAAVTGYQTDNGLTVTGVIDDALLEALGVEAWQAPGITALEALGRSVTGDFDAPALNHPEERYDYFVDQTDGSEYAVFLMLDMQNDEAADIEQHGALYLKEHRLFNAQGEPMLDVDVILQDSPAGRVIITTANTALGSETVYAHNGTGYTLRGDGVEQAEVFTPEEFNFFCESYHFPYGDLKLLNGVRQDDNGYTYFLVQSDDDRSFEFVAGESARIVELRVYERDGEGVLTLVSCTDYDVGPALEIPQAILDAMSAN